MHNKSVVLAQSVQKSSRYSRNLPMTVFVSPAPTLTVICFFKPCSAFTKVTL